MAKTGWPVQSLNAHTRADELECEGPLCTAFQKQKKGVSRENEYNIEEGMGKYMGKERGYIE